MGRKRKEERKEKFIHSSKSIQIPKKSHHCNEEKSKTTMKSKRNQRKKSNSDFDVDSLEHLRNTKKRNKLIDVDEKIKLLKAELMTMFSDESIDKTEDDNKTIDYKNTELNLTQSKENFEIEKNNLKPVFASTPAKFSKDVEETTKTQIYIDPEEQNANILLSAKSQDKNFPKTAKFYVSSLSQEKILELLYKSFIKQNSKSLFSLDNVSDSVHKKSTQKEKHHRFKKQSHNKNEKYIQQNLNKFCISTQRGKKRRIDIYSSDSDVEVVDLDTSSYSDMKPKNDPVHIDFDIKDYNWNEPFVLTNTELPPKAESANSSENKETDEVILNDTDLQKTEISFSGNENNKSCAKKVWECPICFEVSKGQEVVATQCGHIFCKKCVENHFSKLSKNCPSCRIDLKNKPLITLFNF